MRRPLQIPTRSEAGFSLVEVLVTLALTTLAVATLASVVVGILMNSRREAQQTDAYESLRLAAQQILTDGRFAWKAVDDGETLTFEYNDTGEDYTRYIFARAEGGDPSNPVPDGGNLHRWVVRGGVLRDDEIIARDLVPPDTGDTWSWFEASSGPTSKSARAVLVREPLPGQSLYPISLEVKVVQR